ncbi:MAG: helix-turn-helix domain-containing protein [Faecousia sp.]
MAVFRVEKSKDYTVMSNYHLRDNSLSLKSKGLLSQMLSLPEEWDYTLSGLAAINKEGVDAIRAAVQELEQAGYIQRRQTQDENGHFAGNEYVIHESPVCDSPLLDFPITENPLSENPLSEKPLSENPTQLNKDILSKENNKKKNKKEKRATKSVPDWKPERFAAFWEYYRTHCRGESKQAAIRAWDRLQPDDALIDRMGRALQKQIRSPDWQAGIGVPYASTWLNNARWEDELKAADGNQKPEPEPVDYF